MSARIAQLRPALLVTALFGAVIALHRMGTGPLATPTVADFLAHTGRPPAELAMASIRVATLGVALLATVLVTAELVGDAVPAVRRILRRTVPAAARRFARAGLGLRASAAPAVLFASVGPSMLAPPTHAPTAISAPERVSGAAIQDPATAVRSPGTARMRPTLVESSKPPVAAPAVAPADEATASTTTSSDPIATVGTTWTVAPGESFWSIADEITSMTFGRPATMREVDPVWRALLDANRARLIDSDDPDFLLPGQTLDLGGLTIGAHASVQISG